MERKFLEELGLEKTVIDKILDVNSSDIGSTKKTLSDKLKTAEDARDGLQGQLDTANEALKGFEGIDPANIQAELKKAQDALKDAEKQHSADLAKRDSRAETEKLLSSHKFINDITREHYVNAVETALDDPANKGKSRDDIFKTLTQEDEKAKPGIFLEENPNKMPDMPPAGEGAPASDDIKFSFTPINR